MTGRYKKMKKGKSWVIILVAVICIGLLGWYSTAVITDTKQKQEATANGESTKDKDYQNIKLGLDLSGGVSITYHIKDKNPSDKDVNDTIAKLEERAESYTTEYSVYKSGDDRITVEIPGVDDPNKVLEDLGSPGSLYFIAQYDSDGNANYTQDTSVEGGYKLNYDIDTLKANGSVILDGNDVKDASAQYDQSSSTSTKEPVVSLKLKDKAIDTWADATKKAKDAGQSIGIYYDDHFISVPTVSAVISDGNCVINGMKDYDEATSLATFIRVGAINLQLEELESNVVGAQLGGTALTNAVKAAIIGIILIMIFMIVLYGILGVVASIGLALYSMLTVLFIYWFEITLTLPCIAGIILGIGMAVDANVIIYTRIREEIAAGKSVESAILAGYNKATSAIVDGNVTTLIAAIVLYIFGTGPVMGFASTLAVGNIVSIFTALVITKVIMKLLYNFGLTKPNMYGKTVHRRTYNILSIRKWTITVSVVLIVVGFVAMGVQSAAGNRALNFSLEFVGGSTTSFTFDKEYSQSEIENGIIPIIKTAANVTEVQQQKVQNSTKVTFKTTDLSLEQREAIETAVTEKYPLQDGSIVESDTISSSVSATTKRDAFVSVIIATVCMLIYIWFRFRDIRFAAAAVIALIHDVLIVLTFYALARVSVGTTFIACMLTIVGYSINGTIIIFDRIREKLKSANAKTDITELVNSSITYTFTRNVNTTLTTLIMLVCLLIFGVASVKEFAAPLIVGILAGAYSSICITSALWYIMGGKKRGIVNEQPVKAKTYEDGAQV